MLHATLNLLHDIHVVWCRCAASRSYGTAGWHSNDWPQQWSIQKQLLLWRGGQLQVAETCGAGRLSGQFYPLTQSLIWAACMHTTDVLVALLLHRVPMHVAEDVYYKLWPALQIVTSITYKLIGSKCNIVLADDASRISQVQQTLWLCQDAWHMPCWCQPCVWSRP